MRIAKSGITFDHRDSVKRWDKYQEHYNYLNVAGYGAPQFDLFENGSVGFTAHNPDPYWRGVEITPLGVHIFASDKLPQSLFLADGTNVPMAWLHYDGIQNLLLDIDRGVVVGTRRSVHKKRSEVPSNKESKCAVYWAHEDSMPVGSPVFIYRPMKPTKELEEVYAKIKPIAKALVALEGIGRWGNAKVPLDKLEHIARDGLDSIDKHLSHSEIAMIADSTFAAAIDRSREEVQYLYTNPLGETK